MKLTIFPLIFLLSLQVFAGNQLVVVGDTGKDNVGQKAVADAMLRHCAIEVCDYGVLTGDNIYEEGMTSASDPVLDRMFLKYYSALQVPFFVSLGNHDYGKLSNDWKRGAWQLEYSKKNPQYFLPHYFYYQAFEDYVLVVLDTSRLMWGKDVQAQELMIQEAYAKSEGKWFVVVGHHPYLSNGKHGNAGKFEGISFPPFVSGTDVKKFIEKNVCGKAQVYLSGHDHNLQLTDGRIQNCPTYFAVSGAGASSTPLTNRNITLFQSEKLGFLSVTIDSSVMGLKFIDSDNQILHVMELKR